MKPEVGVASGFSNWHNYTST